MHSGNITSCDVAQFMAGGCLKKPKLETGQRGSKALANISLLGWKCGAEHLRRTLYHMSI